MAAGAPRPSRRREAAAAARAETRRRLLRAAEAEFVERGYTAATVVRIADRAGVTVQTLYLAWGSKRALLRAYMETALAGDDHSSYAQVLPDMIAGALSGSSGDPRAVVRGIGALYRQIAQRAAIGWQLYRDAAATDPAVAADWQALQAARHATFTELIGHLPVRSLRRGLTRADAVDTAWAIASPGTYDMLVRARGYDLDQYQEWVTSTLTAVLLRPAGEPPARRRGGQPRP